MTFVDCDGRGRAPSHVRTHWHGLWEVFALEASEDAYATALHRWRRVGRLLLIQGDRCRLESTVSGDFMPGSTILVLQWEADRNVRGMDSFWLSHLEVIASDRHRRAVRHVCKTRGEQWHDRCTAWWIMNAVQRR